MSSFIVGTKVLKQTQNTVLELISSAEGQIIRKTALGKERENLFFEAGFLKTLSNRSSALVRGPKLLRLDESPKGLTADITYVEGETLRNLYLGKRLTLRQAARILAALFDAVLELHGPDNKRPSPANHISDVLIPECVSSLEKLVKILPSANDIVSAPTLTINGTSGYAGLSSMIKKFAEKGPAEQLQSPHLADVYHGSLHFGNVVVSGAEGANPDPIVWMIDARPMRSGMDWVSELGRIFYSRVHDFADEDSERQCLHVARENGDNSWRYRIEHPAKEFYDAAFEAAFTVLLSRGPLCTRVNTDRSWYQRFLFHDMLNFLKGALAHIQHEEVAPPARERQVMAFLLKATQQANSLLATL